MNARSRRQLAVALAVLALLVAAVGTWAARHGRGVSTGPSRPAANPDAGATTSLGTVPVQGPAPTQAAAAPAGPVRVSPGPGTVKVSWDRFPGSVRLYSVEATDQTAGYSGTVFACGSCTETTFQQLINGHQYTFAVAAYLGARPGAPRRSPVATPTSPLCPSGPCLAVDTGLALGPTTQRGQGFLHSISEATDPARAKALQIRSWRGAGGAQQAAIVRRYTGDTIQVVSDYWAQAMYDQARQGVKPPWEDWGAFEHYVVQLVHTAEHDGWGPDYWDALNEPDAGLAPYAQGTVTTLDDLFQVYAHTYKAIRSADPHARIVAPTISGFTVTSDPKRPTVFDMPTFLSYAAAHDLRFDAIAWHETGAEHLRSFDRTPEAIPDHVASLRGLLSQWPDLGHPKVLIDEYMAGDALDLPGGRVRYLASIEAAQPDLAEITCSPASQGDLSACAQGTLGGLLGKDHSTPRSSYWVHLAYAGMTGTQVSVSSSLPGVSGLASAGPGGAWKVLLGRRQSCAAAVNPLCREPASATPPPTPLTVAVQVGGPDRTQAVSVERIPAVPQDLPSVSAGPPQQLAVRNGVVRVALPSLADGDAYLITAG